MNKIILLLSGQHSVILMAEYSDAQLWDILTNPNLDYVKLEGQNEKGETVYVHVDSSTVQASVVMPWHDPQQARHVVPVMPRLH